MQQHLLAAGQFGCLGRCIPEPVIVKLKIIYQACDLSIGFAFGLWVGIIVKGFFPSIVRYLGNTVFFIKDILPEGICVMGVGKYTSHAHYGNLIVDLTVGREKDFKGIKPGNQRILFQEQFLMDPGNGGLGFKKTKAFAGHEITV